MVGVAERRRQRFLRRVWRHEPLAIKLAIATGACHSVQTASYRPEVTVCDQKIGVGSTTAWPPTTMLDKHLPFVEEIAQDARDSSWSPSVRYAHLAVFSNFERLVLSVLLDCFDVS